MKRLRILMASALALSLSAPSSLAFADKPAPKKKGKEAPSVTDAPGTKKPAAPKKEEAKEGPASFNATQRPGEVSPEEEARREAQDKKNDELIDELKNVIKAQGGDTGAKADLIFQLAELYYEKSKFLYSKEMLGYFRAQDEWQKKVDRGEKAAEPKLDNSGSRVQRDQALFLYRQILKDSPTYERKDEVLFTLAYNQYEDGKARNEAVQNYWALIKQYPNSKFLYDAYVQLGEHFFTGNDLERAYKAYSEAFKSTNPRIHAFAQYKLAWCDYNKGDYDGAIKRFKDVVSYTAKNAEKGSDDKPRDIALKNEALNDIVLSFVQVEATDEAIKYFAAQTGKKKAHKLVQKLALRMGEAGKHESAIHVYRALIGQDPTDADAPGYQNAIVHSYEQERKRDQVSKEMLVLVRSYGPKSDWAKANKDNKKALEQAYEDTEGAMRAMVTEYHREAQTTKDVATYKLAAGIYKEYLDNFGTSEYAFNLRFYYAEILFTLQDWEHAADQYEGVVAAEPGEYGNKDYKKSAAYDALLCYETLARIDRGEIKATTLADNAKIDEAKKKDTVKKVTLKLDQKKDQQEEAIPKWEAKLANACDSYTKLVPNDKDEISLRYKAAFIYYDHHHFVESASRFGDIITKWPQDPFSRKAADFTLNILETKEQWSELNRLSRAFFANKKLLGTDKDFTSRLAGLVEGSQYKVNEVLYADAQKKNDQDEKFKAATAFRDFVKEFQKSKYSPQALVYSMVIYQDANHLDDAIDVGEQLLKEYPDTKFTPRTWLFLGSFYDKTAQYPKSAHAFEQYVKMWEKAHGIVTAADKAKPGAKPAVAVKKAPPPPPAKKGAPPAKGAKPEEGEKVDLTKELDEKVADALFNAALFHEGMGEDDIAIGEYQKYVDYVDQKKPGFDKKSDAPEVFFNLGLIHEKAGRKKEAAAAFEAYTTRFAKQITPSKAYYAKYKQFVLLRDLHPPTSTAAKLVEDRDVSKLMDDLNKSYPKLDQAGRDDDGNLNAYGHVRFLMLEPKWKEFVAINFKDPKHLVGELKEKVRRMADIEKEYTEVLGTRSGEWGIAALTRIGLGYEDFARDLIDSPDPKGLTPDQLELYRGEIENKAFPLEDKAVEALEKALDKSSELKLYSEWTLRAQDQLNKVRPGAFGEARSLPYRGSEVFATAPGQTAMLDVPKPSVAPAPAPAPAPPGGAAPAGGASPTSSSKAPSAATSSTN